MLKQETTSKYPHRKSEKARLPPIPSPSSSLLCFSPSLLYLHLSCCTFPLPVIFPPSHFTVLPFISCFLLLPSLFAFRVFPLPLPSLLWIPPPFSQCELLSYSCQGWAPVHYSSALYAHFTTSPPPTLLKLRWSCLSSPGKQGGEELHEPRAGMRPACMPAWDTAVKNRAVFPTLSFFHHASAMWGN